MEAVACDVAAMDFNALSRRELQALCKLNGVRANMTNLAMVEALHSLPSVDGIDQIGTTLCLPTPGKSATKSILRAAAAAVGEDHQQGSPLPRGRRVSLKSPEAIQTDRERGLVKDIVRTPGVALRSTSRRPRATPTPAAGGALRRSQRSTARKAAAPAEVDVATARRSTAKLNMAIDFDQEDGEEKAQEVEEPKGAASDVKCDGPEEEEVSTKLMEGNIEADETEQGEEVASSVALIECAGKSCDTSKVEEAVEEPTKLQEVVSSVALIESAEKSCDNSKVEEVVEEATKPQEGAAIGEEQKLVNVEESVMEDSPIFGVLSKVAPETAMKNFENASTEGFGSWSPVLEIADEINSASEDKKDAAIEMPKEGVEEDATSPTFEAADADSKIILADVTEKEVAAVELPQADTTDDESAEEYGLTEESSQEDGLDEDEDASKDNEDDFSPTAEAADAPNKMTPAAVTEKKVAADEIPQVDPIEDESESDLTEESSDEDEDMENVDLTVDGESDETIEASNSTEVNFDSDEEEELEMLETGEEMKDYEESDSLTGDEDDFSGDLSSEFDSIDFSDAEPESNSSPVALEGIHAAAPSSVHAAAPSSAAKTVDSTITEDILVSSKGGEVSQHVETIVESLDKVTITEAKKEEWAKEKKQVNVGEGMSLRKLKSAYKESLIAAKEGKKLTIDAEEGTRVVLAELDDNAKC